MKRICHFLILLLLLPVFIFSQNTLYKLTISQEDIVYGHKHGLGLIMGMVKPGKPNGKALISIISGNWVSRYDWLQPSMEGAQPFIDAGYTVFLTMHSSAPAFDITVANADIKRAIQYIRYNAVKYGIDPDHIGITGTSSGGHLALLAATSDDIADPNAEDPVERVSSRVQAAAVFSPPTDFLNWGFKGFDPTNVKPLLQQLGLLGAFEFKQFDSTKRIYTAIEDKQKILSIAKAISPGELVTPDDAPTYIVHGDKDMVVPLQQSQFIQEKMSAAKVPIVLTIKPGAGHVWKDRDADKLEFIKWFDKYLK